MIDKLLDFFLEQMYNKARTSISPDQIVYKLDAMVCLL